MRRITLTLLLALAPLAARGQYTDRIPFDLPRPLESDDLGRWNRMKGALAP